MIYNDTQNIHNHHIQNSFRNSLNNILKDKQLLDLDTIKQQIIDNKILTEKYLIIAMMKLHILFI